MDIGSVLIAGGGIGGLTAALALRHHGIPCAVYEQAAELSEVGAGVQLSANPMKVLSALGLKPQILEAGFEPTRTVLRDYQTGKPELSVDIKSVHEPRYGQPYVHIHRADLQRILSGAVRSAGIDIHLGSPVKGYKQTGNSVQFAPKAKRPAGDVIIGADGLHSKIRKHMYGEDAPRFTGYAAWRGLVPASETLKNLIPPDATVWLGPGKHVVAYYVRGGAMINFVAVTEREEWLGETWKKAGNLAALRSEFKGWDTPVTALLGACESTQIWGLFDRDPLPAWTDGRAALLGDACHPMLPFMAQGAAMAIEDAWVIAQRLADTSMPVSARLKAYEAARKPRTARLQNISRRNAGLYHTRRPLWRKAKFKLAQTIPALAFSQFDPIYGGFSLKGDT